VIFLSTSTILDRVDSYDFSLSKTETLVTKESSLGGVVIDYSSRNHHTKSKHTVQIAPHAPHWSTMMVLHGTPTVPAASCRPTNSNRCIMVARGFLLSLLFLLLLLPNGVVAEEEEQPPRTTTTTKTLYTGSKFVQVIETLETIQSSPGIWMLQFCNPNTTTNTADECHALVPDYTLLAGIVHGIYNVGYVDTATAAGTVIASFYDIDTATTTTSSSNSGPIFILLGEDKTRPIRYTGPQNTQDMLQVIMELALETLRTRAGDPAASKTNAKKKKSSSGSGSSKNKPSSSSGKSSSKVIQLTSANFQEEILNSPLVAAVACKYLRNRVCVVFGLQKNHQQCGCRPFGGSDPVLYFGSLTILFYFWFV
jgi:hypothetical protein